MELPVKRTLEYLRVVLEIRDECSAWDDRAGTDLAQGLADHLWELTKPTTRKATPSTRP